MGGVGPIVGSSWYGIPYIKSRYKDRTTDISEDEKNNRNKFAMAHFWLQPLLDFVREGFKNYSLKSRGFNAAKSYLLRNAVEGKQPNISINPALVKVSVGKLPLPADIAVGKTGEGEITFTWNPQSIKDVSDFDQVMVLAYEVETGDASFRITGQFRNVGVEKLEKLTGKAYHCYLAFTAADRSMQSDSVYLGKITM